MLLQCFSCSINGLVGYNRWVCARLLGSGKSGFLALFSPIFCFFSGKNGLARYNGWNNVCVSLGKWLVRFPIANTTLHTAVHSQRDPEKQILAKIMVLMVLQVKILVSMQQARKPRSYASLKICPPSDLPSHMGKV